MTPDAWIALRQKTDARIALGRSGGSLPTSEWLKFGLAHAQARDAVHVALDVDRLQHDLMGSLSDAHDIISISSQVTGRDEYLRRPDLGRKLAATSSELLSKRESDRCDLVLIIADGLSATATQRYAAPVATMLLQHLREQNWHVGPLVIATGARVGLMDEIGTMLHAEIALILLGERPGLSACDSLGAYFTYGPGTNRTDADRNCISNIQDRGLSPERATQTLLFLLNQARLRKLSGVTLKDTRCLKLSDPLATNLPAPS